MVHKQHPLSLQQRYCRPRPILQGSALCDDGALLAYQMHSVFPQPSSLVCPFTLPFLHVFFCSKGPRSSCTIKPIEL